MCLYGADPIYCDLGETVDWVAEQSSTARLRSPSITSIANMALSTPSNFIMPLGILQMLVKCTIGSGINTKSDILYIMYNTLVYFLGKIDNVAIHMLCMHILEHRKFVRFLHLWVHFLRRHLLDNPHCITNAQQVLPPPNQRL